jgi:hypothetical protein
VEEKLLKEFGSSKESCINQDDLEFLKRKMYEAQTEEIDVCNYLKIDTIESMPKDYLTRIIVKLNRTIEKNKSSALAINKIFENKEEQVISEPGNITEEAKEFFGE